MHKSLAIDGLCKERKRSSSRGVRLLLCVDGSHDSRDYDYRNERRYRMFATLNSYMKSIHFLPGS